MFAASVKLAKETHAQPLVNIRLFGTRLANVTSRFSFSQGTECKGQMPKSNASSPMLCMIVLQPKIIRDYLPASAAIIKLAGLVGLE